jgi:hypothetical protein
MGCPVPGCGGCVLDERRVQSSPATHHMFSMDPQRPILMSFSNYSPSDPWNAPKLSQNCHAFCLGCPVPGCGGCVLDERRVQSSPATHHMFSMDQQKTDIDEFQQLKSLRSMESTSERPKSYVLLSCKLLFVTYCRDPQK